MNQLNKQLLCITALVSTANLFGYGTTSKIVPRSQSFNAARQIVGWDNAEWGINRKPQDKDYASFNIIFEYSRTFRDNRLARALFGNDLVCSGCDDTAIQISGSAVPAASRGANAWLADYFGLPRDFQSTVSFKPQISNYILDFSFYAGLDSWYEGAYFKIYGPFVHTKWNLNAQECVSNAGTPYNGSYFQGYFSNNVVPSSQLNTSFLSYANGAVPTINNDYSNLYEELCFTGVSVPTSPLPQVAACSSLGDITWESLCCSKISPECGCDGQGLSRNGFGELRFVLGYNFVNDDAGNYHAGAGLYVAAPTGTRVGSQDECNSNGRYLFEPIVGNGKHWELGAQVTAHHIGWRNEDETKSFGMYLEANITHLFAANQIRCFDLCSAGSNSRYMLAEKLHDNRNSFPGLNAITAAAWPDGVPTLNVYDTLGLEFANAYAPVANITRRNVSSKIAVQADLAISFAYQSGNFQWDLGYNFWGRTCEEINLKNDCCAPALGQWALKGDQRVYGFYNWDPGAQYAMRVAATDSQATIHTGSNMANGVDYTPSNPTSPVNFYADNSTFLPLLAGVNIIPNGSVNTDPTSGGTGNIPMYTSNLPILIQESDFDLIGTRGISNKLFTHFNYAWPEMNDSKWTPYVGIGAEVEFGSGNKGCNTDCNTSCTTSCNTGCTTSCNPCVTTCPTNPYNTNPYNTPAIDNPCSALRPCCTSVALSQWGVWFKIGTSYN
jgi:hypothetical protein